jgi:hypothetical protein
MRLDREREESRRRDARRRVTALAGESRAPGTGLRRCRASAAEANRCDGAAMLQPIRLGVVPFDAVLLALAVYTCPARVAFCRRPSGGLADLADRRIRTSSVVPVGAGGGDRRYPNRNLLRRDHDGDPLRSGGMRHQVVECAFTGTLSGNAIGLHEVTTHVHAIAINWGPSAFGANRAAWAALPRDLQELLRREIADLEQAIWVAADRETGNGLACNAGRPDCRAGQPGRMAVAPVMPADDARIGPAPGIPARPE